MSTPKRALAVAAASVLALSAFAASTGSRSDGRRPLKLSTKTEILGATLAPGNYDLHWVREAKSEAVKLEITHGKTVVASGKGEWASADTPYPQEALVYRGTGGAEELTGIRFQNSADWIKVEPQSPGAVASQGGGTTDAPKK